jgi:hypothetical protein
MIQDQLNKMKALEPKLKNALNVITTEDQLEEFAKGFIGDVA